VSAIASCRICGNRNLTTILDLGDQALTGVFPRDPHRRITSGILDLVKCDAKSGCGLVQLGHSYPLGEMYGENYGYRSGLNRSMVEHLKKKLGELTKGVTLSPGDVVLDIGSNDGTLLSFYPQSVRRIGIDPSAEKFRKYYPPGIELVVDFFSADAFQKIAPGKRAKIVTSIAMFYDLEDPLSFMTQVRDVLADDGIWHLEQSYLPLMLQRNAYDTACHEHLEYYALRQIKWMADRCDLQILDIQTNDINGGSFAITIARRGSVKANSAVVEKMTKDEAVFDTLVPYEEFRERIETQKKRLLDLLSKLRSEGKKVFGYGASTKGNVVLQYCGLTPREIPYIAEVNPDKFGAYTPGSKIPIISEAQAKAMKPDVFLVLPWHFKQNFLEREAQYLREGGKLLFPLPEVELVSQ
jgi:hypothetical protein